MIRHIVILNFKKDDSVDYLDILENTKPLILKIPGVIKYDIYINESKYTPKNVTSFGVEIIFKDKNALQVFMNDPKHYEANKAFEKYLVEPGYMVLTHDYAV